MRDTLPLLEKIPFPPVRRGKLETLQINVGYRCNQTCFHCHVNAGPNRTEEMTGDIADLVLEFLRRRKIPTLDVTGGAPELNPHFRRLVRDARAGRARVMDRCNLTILEQPGQEDLAEFLATLSPVIDQTNLRGIYEYRMTFPLGEPGPRGAGGGMSGGIYRGPGRSARITPGTTNFPWGKDSYRSC